jgi:trigger factor
MTAASEELAITSEPLEPCQARLTVVVSPERIEREMDVVAQAFARQLRIHGYRPGKVPLKIVVAQVGEEAVREAAVEQLAEKVAREAIRAEGLAPYDTPSMEQTSAEPLTYELIVPLAPEVTLGDYRALRVEEPEAEPVPEAEVDERLALLRAELGHLQSVERPAEAGDRLVLALVGRLGERIVVEFESLALDLTPEAAAEADLPPAMVDHLIGHAAGAVADFNVTYSEFWPQPELQGQAVAFTATIESVMGVTLPELDDAFAQEVSDAATLAELRERIHDSLAQRRTLEARERYIDLAVKALVAQADVRYPPSLVDRDVANSVANLRRQVERQGFSWERWLELQEKDEDTVWSEFLPQAEARVANTLVLSEFAAAEGVSVSRKEVDDEARRMARFLAASGLKGSKGDALRRRLENELVTSRTLNRLLAIVSGGADAPPDTNEAVADVVSETV